MACRGTPDASGVGGEDIATGKTDRLIASGQIEGMPVYNRAGEHLGSVHTLMIDTRTGQVTCAVMSFGGFLGIGERHHPLPWRKLECDARLGGILVDIDRAQLEGAPHYGRDETPWTTPSFDRDLRGAADDRADDFVRTRRIAHVDPPGPAGSLAADQHEGLDGRGKIAR